MARDIRKLMRSRGLEPAKHPELKVRLMGEAAQGRTFPANTPEDFARIAKEFDPQKGQ